MISTKKRSPRIDSCPYCGKDLTVCKVPSCKKLMWRSMYCTGHYQRLRRAGSVQANIPLRGYYDRTLW